MRRVFRNEKSCCCCSCIYRKELLCENIENLLGQTRSDIFDILIIN